VAVSLDGDDLGFTDNSGSVSGAIDGGSHVMKVVNSGVELPIKFTSSAGEDVEIKVSLTSSAEEDPQISIQKFAAGDTSGTGYLTGRVLDASGAAITGASVSSNGSSTLTDSDGVYVLEVPRGEHNVTVSADGYNSASISGVRVLADVGINATVNLLAAGAVAARTSGPIEEVFVTGVFNPEGDAASVERYATTITNAIDVEQLERFGDADVASALNRAVGVAVVDRSYATVRGLDGRYISSTLNGLLMPSTDPLRRDVQLDLFPTLMVEGIEIQKSYSPDKLATTTGGAIQIKTKGLPDEQVMELSGSLGVNTEFTGDDILNYASSNDDWLGYDSGLRKLPSGVLGATDDGQSLTICDPAIDPVRCTAPIDAARLGVKFQDDYNVGEKTALPDASVSVAYGDRLSAGDNEWGFYLAADYDRSTSDRGEAELTNPLETEGSYMRSRENTAITGYAAVGYEYGVADEILSKTMYLHNTDDTTRVEQGQDNLEGNQINQSILEWVEREFISQAFTGHNEFEFDHGLHMLDWRASYSRTNRDEPDRRQYTYFNGNLSTSAFERRWSDLEEDSIDIGADYSINLDWGDISSTEVKVGFLWSDKDRDVDQYRFGINLGDNADGLDLGIDQNLESDILSYQNFVLDKVRLAAKTADTDSYHSEEEISAYYLTTNTDFGEYWSVLLGARYEDFDQILAYPNDSGADNELQYDDWYPALNLTWRPTEDIQIRAGYSETASYPGLIERSEAQSFDPDTDDPIFGNPDLQVSTIDNYDIRGEYYFSDTESVSLAVFYKDIVDPVERAIPDASGSAARGITFLNQDEAELLGVELDANVDLIDGLEYLLFVSGNVSWIDSEVTLSDDSIRLEGANADGRELQGQSEWLANVQLGFDHYETEQKFTLLINWFDDRIYRVARGQNVGPEYEEGRIIVDFTYEQIWNDNITIKGSIKNLLNEEVEYSQNGRTIESYETGVVIGGSIKYTF
jgi:outer membrane receptor protein involved in Fe transport